MATHYNSALNKGLRLPRGAPKEQGILSQKLTEFVVSHAMPLSQGRRTLWDTTIPGFGLRITEKGRKSWIVMYRMGGGRMATHRRLTIGTYPTLSLARARKIARDALWQVAQGIDPMQKIKQTVKSDHFDAVAEEFIERYAKPKNRGWKEQQRDIKRDLLPYWRHKQIHAITRHGVIEALDRVSERASPRTANRLLALIKRFFNWCLERGLLETSPAAYIKPPGKEESRDRVLTRDEIRYVWAGCDVLDYPFGSVIKLLLVTAQRRDEVRYMRWTDIDEETATWTVPRERSKNNIANLVPLTPLALKILNGLPKYEDEELVFPAANGSGLPASGYSKAKRRLDEWIGVARRKDGKQRMAGWWLHDLRRTAASSMAQLRVAPHVIERVLNHVSGSQSGVAGIYNRYGYLDEKRQALDIWAEHLEKLVQADTESQVRSHRRPRSYNNAIASELRAIKARKHGTAGDVKNGKGLKNYR